VKTGDTGSELYGIVCNATTSSVEPGRRPIARGRDEPNEQAIYRSNPQLARLLRSEFNALIVGHRHGDSILHHLPPTPPRIHAFVHLCQPEETEQFSRSFGFLSLLLSSRLTASAEEITGASLRHMSQAHEDPRRFLVTAGRELALLLSDDYTRLKVVLTRVREG
jgi:hypothetical protein